MPKEDFSMPMTASYIAEEERLDLSFEGSLDLRLAMDICDICKHVSPGLQSCIIDLHGVDRVFDSGLALLQMLCARLQRMGALVLVLSDDPEVRGRIPAILSSSEASEERAPRRRLRPVGLAQA
jgi:ABC-type transporter Mla MlaB component